MKPDKDIVVIGGGPSGLAVGYFAKKLGLNVKVYEKSSAIGGNCRTIIDGDFRYDTGAHRLHDKNERVTSLIKSLIGKDLLKVTKPSKISFKGMMIDFPLNIPNIILSLNFIVLSKIIFENLFKWINTKNDPDSFKELAYQKYGKTLSDIFLIPYTEKLWGADAELLSPSITGGRLRSLTMVSLMRSFFIGKKHTPRHIEGDFYYPLLGFGEIFNTLGETIGDNYIYLNTPIVRINHSDNMIDSIESIEGEKIMVSQLVSTIPINLLAKTMVPKPPDYTLKEINMLEYRSIMICVLFLDIERFSSNASIYFSDKKCPFTRIYEPKNRSIKMAPKDKTCIVLEIPVGRNNLKIGTSKNKVFKMVLKYLNEKNLLNKESIIDHRIIKINYAYPIIYKNTDSRMKKITSYFNRFKNLHLIGRSASFEYIHTHHIIERSEKLVNRITS